MDIFAAVESKKGLSSERSTARLRLMNVISAIYTGVLAGVSC